MYDDVVDLGIVVVVIVVVVGHHIQQIDIQSRLWSAEQGKDEFSLSPFAP